MPRSAHPKIFAIIIDSWLSCCQVHHPDVRGFLYPFEHDLAAVGRDIEVADDDVATELRELAPIARCEIEGPEVLVLDISAQGDQFRSSRQKSQPSGTDSGHSQRATAAQRQFRNRVRLAGRSDGLHREFRS